MKRVVCLLAGHRFATVTFDGRGRRVQVSKCGRCKKFNRDSVLVMPLNRVVRRRWARDVARKVARA